MLLGYIVSLNSEKYLQSQIISVTQNFLVYLFPSVGVKVKKDF